MKLIGNGDFKDRADRVRAMRYAMQCGFVDAVTIGFASTAEVDEAGKHGSRSGGEGA
jgi:phage head maturation protease